MKKNDRMRYASLILLSIGFVSLTTLLSCQHTASPKRDFIRENIDSTVRPGVDFFQYSNGGWLKKNPIPATESTWGIGNLVVDEIRDRLKKVNEKAAASGAALGTDDQKIGDFYSSAMDSVAINKKGMAPLKPYLDQIDQAHDLNQILDLSSRFELLGMDPFLSLNIGQDDKNSSKIQIQFSQGGIGLPNRDYYFNTDKRTAAVRAEYQKFMGRMLLYCNMPAGDTAAAVKGVFGFEKSLAGFSRKLEDLRDPYLNYHKMTIQEFGSMTSVYHWPLFFHTLTLDHVDSVIVGQPEFFKGLNAELMRNASSLGALKNYLKFNLIVYFSKALPDSVEQTTFHFYRTILGGQTVQKPRWKRTIEMEEHSMGMLLGKVFVKSYFSEQTKTRYERMVDNVVKAFAERIKKLEWMSPATKTKALYKLSKVKRKVGYPDKWIDYSDLHISRTSFFDNIVAAGRFAVLYQIRKYGKPVDRTLWDMTPQTYNAYYNPSNNEIVIPAAILAVPGMKDEDLDDGVVYGYIAASTIGHELTHGFDDQGRQYDEQGNLKNWWTPEDEAQFKKRSQKMVDQFDSYKVLDSLHINGKASLGENIADFGGILIGLDAFKKTAEYRNNQVIDGLTATQRFFLGYSLGWLYQERDQLLLTSILTDVHAPPKNRVNGPMSDVPDFYTAFGVKKGDPMWRAPEDRVQIW